MELGMTQGKLSGKSHNCGKKGHKAVEYWSGGKIPCSNQRQQYQ